MKTDVQENQIYSPTHTCKTVHSIASTLVLNLANFNSESLYLFAYLLKFIYRAWNIFPYFA